MLGPFCIRNLRRSSTPSSRTSYASVSRRGSLDAVVSITGTEYDYNVLMHPESKLRYLDDDDGEIVTAGTSLELAQRLEDPVPSLAKARPRSGGSLEDGSSPSASRPASPNLHIFEIDRRGDSIRIWEEIEERTKQLHGVRTSFPPMAPSTSTLLPHSLDQKSHNLDNNPKPVEPQVSSFHNRAPPFLPRYEDDLSVQLDESDDLCRLQELQEERKTPSEGRFVSSGHHIMDQRTRHFEASNPPKLTPVARGIAKVPAHHTSMRLSDVLNDDVESKEVVEESEPLLVAFREGNLTAEGKRQAMEAGNKLRQRTAMVFQRKSNGTVRFQSPYDNRWASYKTTEPASLSTNLSNPAVSPVDPIPHAAAEISQVTNDFDGSLLHAFRTELAKISKPKGDGVKLCPVPGVQLSQEVRNDEDAPEATTAAMSLQCFTSKLVLQVFTSICSNVTTLSSQLRHQVREDVAPVQKLTGTNYPPYPGQFDSSVRSACLEFELLADKVIKSFGKEAEDAPDSNQKDFNLSAMESGVKCLDNITGAFQRLVDRLQSIEDSERATDQYPPMKIPPLCLVIDPVPRWAKGPDVERFVHSVGDQHLDARSALSSAVVMQPANSRFPAALCTVNGAKEASKLWALLSNRSWDGLDLCVTVTPESPFFMDSRNELLVGLHEEPLPHHISGEFDTDGAWRNKSLSKPFRPYCDRFPYESIRTEVDFSDHCQFPVNVGHVRSNGQTAPRVMDLAPGKFRCDSKPTEGQRDPTGHENPNRRLETAISYRHVPSPMQWDPLESSRGRQSLKHAPSFSSGLPYEYVVPPTGTDDESKRRSVPPQALRRESRSRSRSPAGLNASCVSDVPEYLTVPPVPKSQRPHRSNLPLRQRQLEDEGTSAPHPTRSALRPFASTRTLVQDYKLSGYRPLSQQRPADGPTGARFGNTVVHSPGYPGHARQPGRMPDRSRLLTAATTPLRQSKSMGSIRKPISFKPASLHDSQPVDICPSTCGILNEPFDDHLDYSTKLTAQAKLVPEIDLSNVAPPNSPLVPTRFPTLEQFEGNLRASVPQFPPLPSMEPLVPLRPNAAKVDIKVQGHEKLPTSFAKANDPTSTKVYQGTWPQHASKTESTESSGDFFRRMTGLGEHPKPPACPVSPVPFGPPAPSARLAKPFDPLAETATIHRHQLIEGVRRSATVGGMYDRFTASNRRPYSAYFDGNGRMAWDHFVRGQEELKTPEQNPHHTAPYPVQRRHTERVSRVQRTRANDDSFIPSHQDPSTVESVQSCVDQLKNLGYAKEANGGVGRLVVYAQAANGDLEDAIDMIDEERKAYEERRNLE